MVYDSIANTARCFKIQHESCQRARPAALHHIQPNLSHTSGRSHRLTGVQHLRLSSVGCSDRPADSLRDPRQAVRAPRSVNPCCRDRQAPLSPGSAWGEFPGPRCGGVATCSRSPPVHRPSQPLFSLPHSPHTILRPPGPPRAPDTPSRGPFSPPFSAERLGLPSGDPDDDDEDVQMEVRRHTARPDIPE